MYVNQTKHSCSCVCVHCDTQLGSVHAPLLTVNICGPSAVGSPHEQKRLPFQGKPGGVSDVLTYFLILPANS